MRELWSRVQATFDNFSGRERLLVFAAGFMLALSLLYFAIVGPALDFGDRAEQRLAAAEQQLEAVRRLGRELDEVNQRLASVEQRIQSGSAANLRTKLETLAQRSLVKVESMEPQSSPSNDRYRETKVEVGLKGVTLPQTVDYLAKLQTDSQALSVKSLRIHSRPDKPELLDVTFTVSSFERI